MQQELVGIVGIGALAVAIALRVPVAFAMGVVGIVGLYFLIGPMPMGGMLEIVPFTTVASYSFGVVPLFILMGFIVSNAGFAQRVFETCRIWLGHHRGGVPMASVVGCAAFGAAAGSGLASTASLARIAIPEMVSTGVDRRLAYGVVAAAGPLAQMIPPSVLMIIYAIIAEQSAGHMLIAGILPGILITLAYITTIFFLVRRDPSLAPPVPRSGWSLRIKSLSHVWGIGLLVFVVIGGIYSGTFTPTEAGAVGAFSALVLTILSGRFTWSLLWNSIAETVRTTAMVFLIVIGAFIFSHFLAITQLPASLSSALTSANVPPVVIIIGITIFYLILGLFLDMVAAMFVTLPIILPAVVALGYDPIWFGVMMVFLCEISLATPPFGLGLFIIKGVTGAPMGEIIKGVVPFILADFLILAIFIAFPELILFVPNSF